MKRNIHINMHIISAALTALVMLSGCGTNSAEQPVSDDTAAASSADLTETTEEQKAVSSLSADVSDAETNNYKIKTSGTYRFSGSSDTPIKVDADNCDVVIILDGADITSSDSPALYVKSAASVRVISAGGTVNSLKCTAAADQDSTAKTTAAVWSKTDIVFDGEGSVDIISENGTGIRSKGNITFENGTAVITSRENGVSSDADISVNGGNISITAGGGHNGNDSAKGLKADGSVVIGGGTLTVDCADDAVNAGADLTMKGGTLGISAGDDAVHADQSITVDGGTIDVSACYEGFEGYYITINGGSVNIVSSDDGINAASPESSADTFMTGSDDSFITVNGGTVNVNSNGDGFDSNGKIELNGGNVTVAGPANSDNSAFDSDGEFVINGGNVIGIGSSMMAEAPSAGGANVICVTASIGAGKLSVADEDGNEVFSFEAENNYSSAVISTPDIISGKTYTVSSAGNELGTVEMTDAVGMIGEMKGFGGGFGGRPGKFGHDDLRQNGEMPSPPGDMPFDSDNMPSPPGDMPFDFGNMPDFSENNSGSENA